MAAKASIAASYRWRLALFSLLFIGFGSYFLRDGFVTYPRDMQVSEELDRFTRENRSAEEWAAMARSKGWPEAMPTEKPAPHSPNDVLFQQVLGFVFTPFGLVCGIYFLTRLGLWVASDEQGLSTSSGQRVSFAQITQLDKTRWKNKGIAIVRYRGEGGQEGRIKLDDCNFETEPTTTILREVEARLKPDQIVGGAPPAPAGPAAAPPA